jgi:hypothetical protein
MPRSPNRSLGLDRRKAGAGHFCARCERCKATREGSALAVYKWAMAHACGVSELRFYETPGGGGGE